jgi:RNA polymerase sigma-70 factor (ECF subfamily)
VEGYTHREIAELLDVAVGTVKAQLHRSRRLLRNMLTEDREAAHGA